MTGGIVGINVGANKDSTDRVSDYVKGIRAFASLASYFTVNISSPNTPGLRNLQNRDSLDDLLAWTLNERDEAAKHGPKKPVFLKIAPDLSFHDLDDVVEISRKRGIDALIISNTTVKRPKSLHDKRQRLESGGLSGKPLYPLSTKMLSEAYIRVEKQFPLIGVGGVDSARTAIGKIEAGASLVQLYSALVYKGPALISEIKKGLVERMEKDGLSSPLQLVGRAVEDWQAWPIESFL
jgi:dihydroorotate dehydrogenase